LPAGAFGHFARHRFDNLINFRLDELLALARVRESGADPETVRALPLGSFVALNRLSGGRLSGRVF
jgi:hypothetical protein